MDGLKINATAKVKVTKLDKSGKVIGIEESTVNLTEKEAEALWHSQQQE